MQYVNGDNILSYSAVIIKNLRWPGSLCVAKVKIYLFIKQNKAFVNIYIGDGIKFGGIAFYPNVPLEIGKESEGFDEYAEPNPDKEPEIIEDDTDEEKALDGDDDNI